MNSSHTLQLISHVLRFPAAWGSINTCVLSVVSPLNFMSSKLCIMLKAVFHACLWVERSACVGRDASLDCDQAPGLWPAVNRDAPLLCMMRTWNEGTVSKFSGALATLAGQIGAAGQELFARDRDRAAAATVGGATPAAGSDGGAAGAPATAPGNEMAEAARHEGSGAVLRVGAGAVAAEAAQAAEAAEAAERAAAFRAMEKLAATAEKKAAVLLSIARSGGLQMPLADPVVSAALLDRGALLAPFERRCRAGHDDRGGPTFAADAGSSVAALVAEQGAARAALKQAVLTVLAGAVTEET